MHALIALECTENKIWIIKNYIPTNSPVHGKYENLSFVYIMWVMGAYVQSGKN